MADCLTGAKKGIRGCAGCSHPIGEAAVRIDSIGRGRISSHPGIPFLAPVRQSAMTYRSSWMTEELDVFRDQFRKFLARELTPHAEQWRKQKMVDRWAWRALGAMGA